MTRKKLGTSRRAAIWRAHERRCIYCTELLVFADLDVDHIIPIRLKDDPKELGYLLNEYGLSKDFDIDSLYNLVPTHRHCNLQKCGQILPKNRALHFLSIAEERQKKALSYEKPEEVLESIDPEYQSILLAMHDPLAAKETEEKINKYILANDNSEFEDELIFLRAIVLERQGRHEESLGNLVQLIKEFPESNLTDEALGKINDENYNIYAAFVKTLGRKKGQKFRYIFTGKNFTRNTLPYFASSSAKLGFNKGAKSLGKYLAISMFARAIECAFSDRMIDTTEAIAIGRNYQRRYTKHFDEVGYAIGNMLLKKGELDDAEVAFRAVVENEQETKSDENARGGLRRVHVKKAEAMFTAAVMAARKKEEDGLRLYEKVIADFPDTKYADTALKKMLKIHKKNKDPEKVEDIKRRLSKRGGRG